MSISKTLMGRMLSASCLLALCITVSGVDKASAMEEANSLDSTSNREGTGKVVFPCKGEFIVLHLWKFEDGKLGALSSFGAEGRSIVAVPIGTYKLQGCTIENGKNNWTITGVARTTESALVLEVKFGGEVNLPEMGQSMAAIRSGETGTITSSSKTKSIIVGLVETAGGYDVKLYSIGSGSKCTVPVGYYKLANVTSQVAAKDGSMWIIAENPDVGKNAKPIQIKPGVDIKLQNAAPLSAWIDVRQNGDKVNMYLQIVNARSSKMVIRQKGEKRQPPGFQVLSKSGKVIMSGKFQYG